MNSTKKLFTGLTLLAALPLSAANYVFVQGNNHLESKLCIAVAQDNLAKYKRVARVLSPNRLEHRQLAHKIHEHLTESLNCNGQDVVAFSKLYKADRMSKFLSRYSEHEVLISREIGQLSKPTQNPDNSTIYATAK